MVKPVALGGRAAGRRGVRTAALVVAMGLSVWLGVAGCQFPDYDLPHGASGQAGTGADAGSTSGGVPSAGAATDGGAAGAGGAGGDGSGGTPLVACGPGLVCSAALPAGWLGPVAYWLAKAGEPSDLPKCPDGYSEPIDLHAGLLAPDAECSCTCTPKGQVCDKAANASVFSDLGCINECFHAAPLACTSVSGCNGSQGSLLADAPKPSGTCEAKVTTQPLQPVAWEYDARLCSLDTAEPGSCTGEGELCTPTPERPFVSQLCVYQVVPEGQDFPECPAGYPHPREPLYDSFTDGRKCSSCRCTGLTGGTCAGTLTLNNQLSCGSGFDYQLGSGCKQFSFSTPPSELDAHYTLVPGTCGISSDTEPTGGAIPSGSATVVCCL